MKKTIKKHFVRISVFIFSIISLSGLSGLSWLFIKYFNKFSKKKFKSIFVCYPGHQRYIDYFFYSFYSSWLAKKLEWKVVLLGFHYQNGYFGMNFAIPMDEKEITDIKNKDKLEKIVNDLDKIRNNIGVDHINYAGILPSVLKKRKLKSSQSACQSKVSEVVFKVMEEIIIQENLIYNDILVIILGGKGFIGTEFCNLIKMQTINYIPIDMGDFDKFKESIESEENKDKVKILINISRRGVLEKYIDLIKEDTIILNEVYPEPNLEGFNCKKSFHIKGIAAKMYPSLPHGYSDALPCCALIESKDDYKVVFKENK